MIRSSAAAIPNRAVAAPPTRKVGQELIDAAARYLSVVARRSQAEL